MLTRDMWKLYIDSGLEFKFDCLMAGLSLVIFTPFALVFDLIFAIPEIIMHLTTKEVDE